MKWSENAEKEHKKKIEKHFRKLVKTTDIVVITGDHSWGRILMYHYIQDKDFRKRLKSTCSDIVNQLVQSINKSSVMTVKACLVGSGAQNLVTQNANNPIDLDYNICIIDTKSIDINDGREIKEYIRKEFNSVLK